MGISPNPIPVPTTAAAFRITFPDWTPALASDASIEFWLMAASCLLNPVRWKNTLGLATYLFVQHNLALEALANDASKAGAIPGLATGPLSSEQADKVSASYDSAATSITDGGPWNYTTYGQRLLWLARLFGAGPLQVGPGGFGPGFSYFLPWTGGAYCGPGWYLPF